MNFLTFLFSTIGFTAAVLALGWILVQALEYCWEVRRTLRDCREALRRLEDSEKKSI